MSERAQPAQASSNKKGEKVQVFYEELLPEDLLSQDDMMLMIVSLWVSTETSIVLNCCYNNVRQNYISLWYGCIMYIPIKRWLLCDASTVAK